MRRVSVVIPTYNRPEYLPRAIDTALHQRVEDLEVVVVDDGSETEYAQGIIEEYSDSVRCFEHEENRGLSAARNTGIDHANGEYVAFLDDDDLWHRDKLSRQLDALDESGWVLATCRTASITPSGEVLRCESKRPDGDLSRAILRTNLIGSPSRVVVPQRDLSDVRFDEGLPTKQDWDFYIRLCQRGKVHCVQEWHTFRVVHESMSSSPTAARRDIGAVVDKHETRIRDAGLWDETVSRYETRVGRAYLGAGNGRSARGHLLRAFRTEPGVRSALLMLFSLLPTPLFDTTLDLKRLFERLTRDCGRLSLDHGVDLDSK